MSSSAGEPLILITKLFPPAARTELLHRTRLTARLADGLKRPVTLVSAPSGAGKTTVVADWLVNSEGRRLPPAWSCRQPCGCWAAPTGTSRVG